MIAELIDTIYEAAFIPEKWPAALAQAAEAASSKGVGLILFAHGQPVRGKTIPSLQHWMDEFLANETFRLSTSATRVTNIRPASFVDIDSLMTAEEARDDAIRLKQRALGLGARVGTVIPMPSGEIVHFVFQRALENGSYSAEHFALLNRLRPDMARAGLAAARLGLEQARGAVEALAIMGFPAAVLAANGRVKVTNALFDEEQAIFLPTAFGGVALSKPESNRLFQLALQAPTGHQVARSIPLHVEAASPIVVHVLPLKRDAHDLFSGGDLLIVATTISASALIPSPTILTGLFDLTPAEAELATALAKGMSLKDAAADAGLQFSTVRTYLNRIFRKTGTNQQSQLVALLKSTHPLRT